jgi:hypothetical protein
MTEGSVIVQIATPNWSSQQVTVEATPDLLELMRAML